jgi:hypothetical protein
MSSQGLARSRPGLGLRACAIVVAAGASAGAAPAASMSIYVSPGGDDCNPGTQAAPLATLQAAQQRVRTMNQSMTGDIDVVLADGFYRLSQPLTLTPADSGSNGHNVVWTATPGTHPVVAGSVQITQWSVYDSGKNIWMAQGPTGIATRQLYVNGVRAQRAQGPVPVGLSASSMGFTAASAVMAGWKDPSGQPPAGVELVFLNGYAAWTEVRCPVASMLGTTITMVEPCWQNSYNRAILTAQNQAANLVDPQHLKVPPTSVENAFELLTQPGQWYLDSHSSRFYYMPNANEDLTKADVEAPVLSPYLVTGNGTATEPIHDIVFNGIQFSYATDLEPSGPDGFSEIQANYTITGQGSGLTQGLCSYVPNGTCPYGAWTPIKANVSFTYDQRIQFTNDAFVHLGGAGLGLGDGSQNDVVRGNVVTDVSGNGIQLGNVDIPDATGADQTLGNVIADNHVFEVPVEFHAGIGIDIGYSKNTQVIHNQIDHTSYSGLSNGWGGWRDKIQQPGLPNYSRSNVISNNLIFDVTTVMTEGAAIYSNGAQGTSLADGLTISGNVLHDLVNGTPHLLYTDNGSYAITITGNAIYNGNGHTAWGSLRTDYTANNGTLSPFDVEHNYWEDAPSPAVKPAATVANNTAITSPSEIPASIVSAAGLESAYQGLLAWQQAPLPPVGPTGSSPAGGCDGGPGGAGSGSGGSASGSGGEDASTGSGGSSGSSGGSSGSPGTAGSSGASSSASGAGSSSAGGAASSGAGAGTSGAAGSTAAGAPPASTSGGAVACACMLPANAREPGGPHLLVALGAALLLVARRARRCQGSTPANRLAPTQGPSRRTGVSPCTVPDSSGASHPAKSALPRRTAPSVTDASKPAARSAASPSWLSPWYAAVAGTPRTETYAADSKPTMPSCARPTHHAQRAPIPAAVTFISTRPDWRPVVPYSHPSSANTCHGRVLAGPTRSPACNVGTGALAFRSRPIPMRSIAKPWSGLRGGPTRAGLSGAGAGSGTRGGSA